MNRDEVIRMAREAGLWPTSSTVDLLERFAALVAACEREACARVCEEIWYDRQGPESGTAFACSQEIRVRGAA